MVGPLYDCVANPLGVVRSTFKKALTTNSGNFMDEDWGVIDVFRRYISDPSSLTQVPIVTSLNIHRIPPKTLVRFRGMVLDMLGKEIYIGVYKDRGTWKTNKYSDGMHMLDSNDEDSLEKNYWERNVLLCVPIPGISTWANVSSDESLERYLDYVSLQRDKRSRTEMEVASNDVSNDYGISNPSPKKMKEESHHLSGLNSASHVPELPPSAPVKEFSCLIKIYNSSDCKLNEIYEFLGVLEPPTENFSDDNDQMDIASPYNNTPRLHCILERRLSIKDLVPDSPFAEPIGSSIGDIKTSLLNHLSCVLGDDNLTAHYLLLHLLSSVQSRTDNLVVGKLSLNITCFDKESASVFGKRLESAIKSLVPISESVRLTVEYLNEKSIAPKKDYEANRLIPGSLYLAHGSHLTFNETTLEPGTLNSTGVQNARSLKSIVETQKVGYDFTYYQLDMPVDVQVMVLSEGKSNIMPADVVIPFRPRGVTPMGAVEERALDAWRWYLASGRSLSHAIDGDVQRVLENDYVAARQADQSLSFQDFSRWLTVGRLISVSFGKKDLSLEHWSLVREIERLRMERLSG